MTVKELIEYLRKYDGDEKVIISQDKEYPRDVKDVRRKGNEPEDEDYKVVIISNF